MKMKLVNETGLARDSRLLVQDETGKEFDLLNACHVTQIVVRVDEVVEADLEIDLASLELVVEGKLVGDPVSATHILDDLSNKGFCVRGEHFRYVGKRNAD